MKNLRVLVLFAVFFSLISCGGIDRIAAMSGRSETDLATLELARPLPVSEFIDGTATVGRSSGFVVDNTDRSYGMVGLSSTGFTVFNTSKRITVTLKQNQIQVRLIVSGGSESARAEEVEKILNDFKAALSKQFGI